MTRHRLTAVVVALAAAAALLVVAALSSQTAPGPLPRADVRAVAPTPTATTKEPAGRLLQVAGARVGRPVEIRVPAVGISSRLDNIGVLPDGTLERPPRWQVAGWFAGGPRPGEIGPAVIAGHVDSPDGPAVFARLSALRPGDVIEVDDVAGVTTTFEVDRLTTAPKNAFPTEAVYGQTPDPQLRLITCSGPYDAANGGYQDNLMVFATQVTS